MHPEELMLKLKKLQELVEKEQEIRLDNSWNAMRKDAMQKKIKEEFESLLVPA